MEEWDAHDGNIGTVCRVDKLVASASADDDLVKLWNPDTRLSFNLHAFPVH